MAEITKVALKVDNNTSFPNNNAGAITPAILRAFNVNMIDSMVDEIGYNADSASWNVSISNINAFTASAQSLTTASLLITASAQPNSNVITFTKGNGSTFNVTVATGSIPDISNLNQATASLQAFTQSAQISINNLNTTTASLNTSVTNINTFTASTAISITNLNASSASQQVSIDSINSKTGSFATTGSNTFVSANTFTSISASSFISASQFVGDGSKITNITASIALPILDEGIPQGNAFSMNFTGSGIGATVVGGIAIVSVYAPDSASFNSLTASFNAYTASTNSDLNAIHQATASLQTNSASVNTSITNLNASSASQQISIDALNTNSASVNTSISALNTFTASQSTASLVTSITNLNTFSASALVSISNINSTTASLLVETQNLELFSASALISISNLNASSASQQISIDNLNTNSASVNTSITNLNSATASLFGSASLSLYTASAVGNTITFTKGDASTFNVSVSSTPIDTGSFATTASFNAYTQSNDQKVNSLISATGSYATTGSNTFVGNQTITGSINISGSINMVNGADLVTHHVRAQGSNGLELQTSAGTNIVQMGAGGGTQATFVGAVSANSISASTINGLGDPLVFSTSVDSRLDSLEGITGSYATTGSNSFNGNQIITGSVYISSSATVDLRVEGQIFVSSSVTGGTTAPKITVSGSAGTSTINRNSISTRNLTNTAQLNPDATFAANLTTFDEIGFTVNAAAGAGAGWSTGPAIYVNNDALDSYNAVFGFQNKANYTDGRVAVLTPLSASAGFTASLQNGYAWVGNSLGQNTQVATSSFGGALPSGVISGSAQITALGFVSSSVTASSLVTASVNLNTITFTKGDSSTFALTVDTGSGGGGAAFPFVGDAVITGSLTVSGSTVPDIRLIGNIDVTGSLRGQPITLSVASSTASLNMTEGNNFILTLPSSSTTHINATNIVPGQTLNLLIKQQIGPATGSITFAPTILFPSGVDMQATQTGSAIDLVSMISFDTTNLMAANVKNLK